MSQSEAATSTSSSSPSTSGHESPLNWSPNRTAAGDPHTTNNRIEQLVQGVLDFSSQYGSDSSISFTAHNITGAPSKFPEYGDFPETFAMRTYGRWWQQVPSFAPEIMAQSIPAIVSEDYIVLHFEEYVLPEKVSVFETYNPGAVVQIWAFTIVGEWQLLWQSLGQTLVARESRIFAPPLRQIAEPTKIIRIDFNHQHLEYFTELDAVLLTGIKFNPLNRPFHTPSRINAGGCKKGRIQRRLDKLCFKPKPIAGGDTQSDAMLSDLLANGLDEFLTHSTDVHAASGVSFQTLPYELLVKICGYLDLSSLFRLAETCRLLRDVSSDPILYAEVNLRPYWHLVDESCLSALQKRCRLLKKLDISWLVSATGLNSEHIISLLLACGQQLTQLRMNSVHFLSRSCVDAVAMHCANLRELSLRNYAHGEHVSAQSVSSLRQLVSLDLYRTSFPTATLVALVQQNPNMQHLNLAQHSSATNMDEVAWQLGTSCPRLVSIDLWKSHGLTAFGLAALANCPQLAEIDLGWCLRQELLPGESLKIVLKSCAGLQRLGLASVRGLTAEDLDAIAAYGLQLQQLELMGIMGLNADHCVELLRRCKHLRLLDISFCDNIEDGQVAFWRELFNVDIKRGVRASDDL